MNIHIETSNGCPYCGEPIIYHCKMKEQIEQCKWMQQRKGEGDENRRYVCQTHDDDDKQ